MTDRPRPGVQNLTRPEKTVPHRGESVEVLYWGRELTGEFLGWKLEPVLDPLALPTGRRLQIKKLVQLESGLQHRTDTVILKKSSPAKLIWEDLPRERCQSPANKVGMVLEEYCRTPFRHGLTLRQLASKFHALGYELYLVGGCVRDAICGDPSHDFDVGSNMPVLEAMIFFSDYLGLAIDYPAVLQGHLRVPTVPCIDYCWFHSSLRGSPDAWFDSSIEQDIRARDFACNCIYYDIVNNILVDPTGNGVKDASQKRLTPIWVEQEMTEFLLGQIAVRYFKFRSRGYQPSGGCKERILDRLDSLLAGLISTKVAYVRRQVIEKASSDVEKKAALEAFMEAFIKDGKEREWITHFEPVKYDLLGKGR